MHGRHRMAGRARTTKLTNGASFISARAQSKCSQWPRAVSTRRSPRRPWLLPFENCDGIGWTRRYAVSTPMIPCRTGYRWRAIKRLQGPMRSQASTAVIELQAYGIAKQFGWISVKRVSVVTYNGWLERFSDMQRPQSMLRQYHGI